MLLLANRKVVFFMELNLTLKQKQQLSQTQIQALEILAMDSIELNQFLRNEYLENPLLEHNDNTSSSISEPLTGYYESMSSNNSALHFESESESKRSRDIPVHNEGSIRDYLLQQLDPNLYTEREWKLFDYLIECLDDNGFFSIPLEEVAEKSALPVKIVQKCLAILKQLEPYGIFSANLEESLLRQLDALDLNNEVLSVMISNHLQDIADGKISNISREMHLPTVEVRKNIELISHLNPRLLSGFGSEKNDYIIPDIIFQQDDGEWCILLNDSWIENYSLNDYYVKMMESSSDPELSEYFKAKRNRVQFILNSIQQRRQTILAISKVILKQQQAFFESNAPLVPMTMSDVADEIGVHTSTVSRAIKGKYLQYPHGSLFIKNLFTSSVSANDGNNGITPMYVKQLLKEMIEQENKKKPYSDQALANLLKEQGIQISRRAVAKYREEMGIRGSFDRKDYSE